MAQANLPLLSESLVIIGQQLPLLVNHLTVDFSQKLDHMMGLIQRMDQRLSNIEVRLDGIEGRLDRVEGNLGGMKGRPSNVDAHLSSMDTRLGNTQAQLVSVEGQTRSAGGQANSLDDRLSHLEKLVQNIGATVITSENQSVNQALDSPQNQDENIPGPLVLPNGNAPGNSPAIIGEFKSLKDEEPLD
ncbi:hypothetical protein BDV93DRAFT_607895 [Ceratobasidium sp. AG-I]|nr:hypothetical protein BDV93DRAFT_607895 [Ceratobasidium sp. AG-I]